MLHTIKELHQFLIGVIKAISSALKVLSELDQKLESVLCTNVGVNVKALIVFLDKVDNNSSNNHDNYIVFKNRGL